MQVMWYFCNYHLGIARRCVCFNPKKGVVLRHVFSPFIITK